jgi:hypothetical protein
MRHLAIHYVLFLVVVVDDQVAAHIQAPLVGIGVGSYCGLDPGVSFVRITPAGKKVGKVCLVNAREPSCRPCLVGLHQQQPGMAHSTSAPS